MTRRMGAPFSSMRLKMTRVCRAEPSMAAKSSSAAVWERSQPKVTPPRAGLTRTVRSPLSQVRRRRPVWPALRCAPSSVSAATVEPARRAMAAKTSPTADIPASMPTCAGSTDPGTTPQTPGTSVCLSLRPMMQVEVPMTLTTSPRRMLAPMASQCASKAPVGMGIPAVRPNSFAHFSDRWPAILSEVL